MHNETTRLVANNGGGDEKSENGVGRNAIQSQHSIGSLLVTAGSFSEALSESMKRIGFLGSTAIAVNSLTGPAMLSLPATYQRSGLIPTTFVIIFVCILSAYCCLHMSNTISKVPNNHDFNFDIGYSECFRRLWGPRSYKFTQVSNEGIQAEQSNVEMTIISRGCSRMFPCQFPNVFLLD